jgi:hypothetical protein
MKNKTLTEGEIQFCINSLNSLKQALSNSNASVIVGSGFSKNANIKYLSWNEMLYEPVSKMYKDEYRDEINKKLKIKNNLSEKKILIKNYYNTIINKKGYLKIVDEYIDYQKHRESIDLLIEKIFCPLENSKENNLDIHKLLFKCPWNNIFTSNYDTLLEQTNNELIKDYIVIDNSSDLSIRNNRRIIKLHGTLRSNDKIQNKVYEFDNCSKHQYIISSKDYNDYPKTHEAFMQLMRISLLQEYFILIGFSGDDPNFLSWLEWVKDILEKNKIKDKEKKHYKIILIDLSNENIAESKKLYYHNLGICWLPIKNNDIRNELSIPLEEKDLSELIKYLLIYLSKKEEFLDEYEKIWKSISELKINDIEIFEYFNTLNNKFNSLILPKNHIYGFYIYNFLVKLTNKIISIIEMNDNDEFLKYLSIINITIKSSFIPLSIIFDQINLLKLTNLFRNIDYISLSNENKHEWNKFSCLIIKNCRFILNINEFLMWKKAILNITQDNNLVNTINYEECLLYANLFDYEKLENILDKWKILDDDENIFWMVKRIFILLIIKKTNYIEESYKLINVIKKTKKNNKQIQLWCLELLNYYEFVFRILLKKEINEEYRNEIKFLEAEGFFTIESVLKSIIPNEKKDEIKPWGSELYNSSRSTSIGNNKKDIDYLKNIRFMEIIYEIGTTLSIKNIYFIDYYEWRTIYKNNIDILYNNILALSFQYTGNDRMEEKWRRNIQEIIYSRNIDITNIKQIFYNLLKFNEYYFKRNGYYNSQFLFALAEFVKVIDYNEWKDIFSIIWKFFIDKNIILNENEALKLIFNSILIYISDKEVLKSTLHICIIHKGIYYSNSSDFIHTILFSNIYVKKIDFDKNEIINHDDVDLLLNRDMDYDDFIKLLFLSDYLTKEQRNKILKYMNNYDLNFIQNSFIKNILYLLNNDNNLQDKFKKIILSRKWFSDCLDNKINWDNDSIDYKDIKKTNAFKYGLEFSIDELIIIFNDLKKTFDKIKILKNENIFNYNIKGFYYVELKMYNFLIMEGEKLKNIFGYDQYLNEIKESIKFELFDINIFPNDDKLIMSYLTEFSTNLYEKPDLDQSEKWLQIVFRILNNDEKKLEVCLEFVNYHLLNFLFNKEWAKKYQNYYLLILKKYFNEKHDHDVLFVEKQIIALASILKLWNNKDEIVDKILEYKKNSKFIEIREMNKEEI